MKTFPLKHSLGTIEIDPAKVVRVEGSSNYSKIYFTDRQPLLVCKILQWFEAKLAGHLFVRVHRSHLVNKHHMDANANGSMYIMVEGALIPVSRRRRKAIF